MKKIQYYNRKVTGFLSLLLMLLLIQGCTKVLDDVQNLASYPAAGTFDDLLTANAFTANLYASTLGGWPVNMGNNCDEGGGILGDGWVTIDNGTMKFWPFATIRKINILLKELPLGKIPVEKQGPMIGQAKFLRAYNYFKMVYYHGGVPIIETPQELTDNLMVTRNTTAQCFDFIIKNLDEAAALLPPKYTGTDRGKADQAVVKAFKGRVLLYKASPQFNSANPYGNANWAAAYNANKEAKDFLDANGYGLLDDYTKVFETKGHKENVLSVIYSNPAKTNGRGEDGLRPLSESKNATGYDQPIWSMVEAFPMKDGKKAGDPTSAYPYNIQTYWKNRDPRFDATIAWNGSIYELSGVKGRRQYTMSGIAKSMDAWGYIIQGEGYYTRTGNYCRKGIMEELPSTQVTLNDIDWPEIRYAEVLFNYAESANETGKTGDALDVLKAIRKRAGILAGTDGMYGLKPAMTREEMRTAILDEKRVEFMFEGHRFWDLRRHRMFGTYLNGMRKYGIMAMTVNGHLREQITPDDIAKANSFQLLPEDFTYSIEEQITNGPKQMVMPDKYYFFPIQLVNINQNANLKQNKDWGGDFNPEL
jgi:hypothetical protein